MKTAAPEDTVVPEDEVLDGYVPPPYLPPATLDERLAKLWREVTRTPGRAALATLDLCALTAFLISLRTIPITTSDATGPLRARCGLGFYVAGAPNRAVDSACRYAYASRVPVLVVLALLVIGVTALLVRSIVRPAAADEGSSWRRWWQELTRTPGRAALLTFDVAAFVALVAAAQPVNIVKATAAGPLRAHCGLRFFVLGSGNTIVRDACRHAYGPRASVFFVMLGVVIIATVALIRMVMRGRYKPPRPALIEASVSDRAS